MKKIKKKYIFSNSWAEKSSQIIYKKTCDLLRKKKKVNFFLTGGETSKKIYPNLKKKLKDKKNKINFYLSDERIVGLGSKSSNSKLVLDYFIKKIFKKKNFFYIARKKNQTLDNLSVNYSKSFNTIDILLLTLAADGHIASIFENYLPPKNIKSKYFYFKKKNENFFRMSLTPDAILSARIIFVMVYGKNRYKIYRMIKTHKNKYYPARMIYKKAIWLIKK